MNLSSAFRIMSFWMVVNDILDEGAFCKESIKKKKCKHVLKPFLKTNVFAINSCYIDILYF